MISLGRMNMSVHQVYIINLPREIKINKSKITVLKKIFFFFFLYFKLLRFFFLIMQLLLTNNLFWLKIGNNVKMECVHNVGCTAHLYIYHLHIVLIKKCTFVVFDKPIFLAYFTGIIKKSSQMYKYKIKQLI